VLLGKGKATTTLLKPGKYLPHVGIMDSIMRDASTSTPVIKGKLLLKKTQKREGHDLEVEANVDSKKTCGLETDLVADSGLCCSRRRVA